MQWLDRKRLGRDVLAGTFLNLASPAVVEITAGTGFDWILLDLEHGSGHLSELRSQLLAMRGSPAAPIVRIPSVDQDIIKFVMDSGAAGIMFPYVSSAAQAAQAVEWMKYPPTGIRGVAGIIRATDFGRCWSGYFEEANAQSLVVVQIENPEGVEASAEIAAVPGVDVLFVGPLDLSVNLGTPGIFTTPEMRQALTKVVQSCRNAGKVAGILSRPELVNEHREMGFQFLALGSDSGAIVTGMQQNLKAIRGN
jgi:4-hydroxy-2-oxoheptanedioate aldolase